MEKLFESRNERQVFETRADTIVQVPCFLVSVTSATAKVSPCCVRPRDCTEKLRKKVECRYVHTQKIEKVQTLGESTNENVEAQEVRSARARSLLQLCI